MSVVVVYYRDADHLAVCVEAVLQDPAVTEIVVVDNASGDGVAATVGDSFRSIRVVDAGANLGFGGGANVGATYATGDILVFMNPDVVVLPGALSALVAHLQDHGGVAGPVLRNGPDGGDEHGATVDRMLLPRGLAHHGAKPLFIQGCCLGITRACFDAVGGFDARYFLIEEDVELCWQALRRGFCVDVVPTARVHHVGGSAIGGGYRRGAGIETSSQRILLRERNSWALLLACVPSRALVTVWALSLLRGSCFSGLLFIRGRRADACKVWTGPFWSIGHLGATLARRRRPGVRREHEEEAWNRLATRPFILELMWKRERLQFVDDET